MQKISRHQQELMSWDSMRLMDSQATAQRWFTFFMRSSLEMTRTTREKNGSKVIDTGNFQVVHGDAFLFLGKDIL